MASAFRVLCKPIVQQKRSGIAYHQQCDHRKERLQYHLLLMMFIVCLPLYNKGIVLAQNDSMSNTTTTAAASSFSHVPLIISNMNSLSSTQSQITATIEPTTPIAATAATTTVPVAGDSMLFEMILAPRKHLFATNIVVFLFIYVLRKCITIFCKIEYRACVKKQCNNENCAGKSSEKKFSNDIPFSIVPARMRYRTMPNFGFGEGHYQIFVEEAKRYHPTLKRYA